MLCFWCYCASFHHYRAPCHIEKMLFAVMTLACRTCQLILREILPVERGLEGEMPALGNLPKIMVFWATMSIVAIHSCLSFAFQMFFHTYYSYQSQMSPPRRHWQLFLKTETEKSSLSLFSPHFFPFEKIREDRHGRLPPAAAEGSFTEGTEELWSFTSSAPGRFKSTSPPGQESPSDKVAKHHFQCTK